METGQRPQRGRSPVEHRGTFCPSVHSFVHLSIHPEAPIQASEALTHAFEAPIQVSKAPTQPYKSLIQASEALTQASEAPTQAFEAPEA